MHKSRGQVPGRSDAVCVEPVGDSFRAVAAREVIELGMIPRRGFLRSVQQMLPMFGLERFAEPAEQELYFVRGLLQVRGRPARRGRGIVQFMGQTRGHSPERNKFFSLLRVAFQVPHPIRGTTKNLARNGRARAQHPPETLFVEPEKSSRFGY